MTHRTTVQWVLCSGNSDTSVCHRLGMSLLCITAVEAVDISGVNHTCIHLQRRSLGCRPTAWHSGAASALHIRLQKPNDLAREAVSWYAGLGGAGDRHLPPALRRGMRASTPGTCDRHEPTDRRGMRTNPQAWAVRRSRPTAAACVTPPEACAPRRNRSRAEAWTAPPEACVSAPEAWAVRLNSRAPRHACPHPRHAPHDRICHAPRHVPRAQLTVPDATLLACPPNGLVFSCRERAARSVSKTQRSRARSGQLQCRVGRYSGGWHYQAICTG